MRALVFCALILGACAGPQAAAPLPAAGPVLSMQEILDQSPAGDWRALDPDSTLYMDLPAGRVIIELDPNYAPLHAANLRALVRAHYFDRSWVVRAQDNYVVQWSRDENEPAPMGEATAELAPEFTRERGDAPFFALRDPDSYAPEVGFSNGFPVARNNDETWLAHCYGMVGAGRGDTARSGGGTELYVVIGQSPRHLDRNIALVGRVVQGMELLSVMPRGTGTLGFYETPQERTPIASIRLASELPAAQRVNLKALRTDSATFAQIVDSRRTRRDSWFLEPTGHINLCNVPLPVRVRPN